MPRVWRCACLHGSTYKKRDLRAFFRHICPATRKLSPTTFPQYMRRAAEATQKPDYRQSVFWRCLGLLVESLGVLVPHEAATKRLSLRPVPRAALIRCLLASPFYELANFGSITASHVSQGAVGDVHSRRRATRGLATAFHLFRWA